MKLTIQKARPWNLNFFYDKPKKIKDSKQMHILANINFLLFVK